MTINRMTLAALVLLTSWATAEEAAVQESSLKSLRLAIENLAQTFPAQYTHSQEYLKRLETLEKTFASESDKAKLNTEFTLLQKDFSTDQTIP